MPYPLTRVLALLDLLQAHPGLTGRELADRLEVDQRTLRRYVTRLTELGIPVEADRGRYGGYRLLPGYRLPPLMLTDDEATAVVLGLLASERLGLATAGAPAPRTALAKIERVLPLNLRERIRALREILRFTLPPAEGTSPTPEALLAFGAAVREHRGVRLRYRSWKGEESDREFDPYGLVFHAGRWYVIGHDHRRGQSRTFRLDRVLSVARQSRTYVPPENFDPIAHLTRSLASVPYRWEVEVLLRTTSAEASRWIPATLATLTETDEGVLLRAWADDLDGMARMLAGIGFPFRIHRPDELRAAVTELAGRLAGYALRKPEGV